MTPDLIFQPDNNIQHRDLGSLTVDLDPDVSAVIASMDLHISFTKELPLTAWSYQKG